MTLGDWQMIAVVLNMFVAHWWFRTMACTSQRWRRWYLLSVHQFEDLDPAESNDDVYFTQLETQAKRARTNDTTMTPVDPTTVLDLIDRLRYAENQMNVCARCGAEIEAGPD